MQIKEESRKFSNGTMLKSVVVYGGTSVSYQKETLSRGRKWRKHTSKAIAFSKRNSHSFSGVNILIATPGRLLDFLERGDISFKNIKYLVLDEADRMLDMGFMDDVRKMVRNPEMPDKRNTLMFSATFPEQIQQLAAEFLHDYLFLAIGVIGGACADVKQDFFEVGQYNKREKLIEILKDLPAVEKKKMLIFVEKKKHADFLASWLSQHNDAVSANFYLRCTSIIK